MGGSNYRPAASNTRGKILPLQVEAQKRALSHGIPL